MKKRKILVILIVITLAITGFVVMLSMNKNKDNISENKNNSYTDKSSEVKTVIACEVFSLDDAKKILGDSAKQQVSYSGTDNPTSENIQADSSKLPKKAPNTIDNDNKQFTLEADRGEKAASTLCTYWKPSRTAEESDKNTIAIAVRSSIQSTAKRDFEATQKKSAAVDGLGDGAYWKTGDDLRGKKHSQLYVLKGQNLLVVSAGDNQQKSINVAQVILERL